MQLFKYVIENWEIILSILAALGVTGIGGYKGAKAIQKSLDQSQWKSINKNTENIKQLNSKMNEYQTELKRNTEADLEFRREVRELQKDTNGTVKEIQKLFADFLRKDWVDLIKQVYKGK